MGHAHVPGHEEDSYARPEPVTKPAPPMSPLGLMALQRAAGNAAATRQIQRYAVGVPATASYDQLLAWIINKNPYAKDGSAAKTKVTFAHGPVSWEVAGEAGSWTVTPKAAPTITGTPTVDMPVWTAKDPELQKVWSAAVTTLRAHEAVHEGVAATWKAKLVENSRTFSFDSTAKTKAAAITAAGVQFEKEWKGWLAEHQAEQVALDPYDVTIEQPAAPAAASPVTPAVAEDG